MNAIFHNDPMLCDNLRKGIKYLENSKLEFEDMKKEFCMDYWVGIKKEWYKRKDLATLNEVKKQFTPYFGSWKNYAFSF